MIQTPRVELCILGNNIYLFCLDFFWNIQPIYIGLTFSKLSEVEQNFQQIVRSRTQRYAPATRARTDRRRVSAVRASQTPGFEYVVRDGAFSARADFQPVPRCLTHRPCYAPSKMRARVVSEKRENDVNARYGNYQMRITSSDEIIKYKSLTSSVVRKHHNVA